MSRFLNKYRPMRFSECHGINHLMPVIRRIVEDGLAHGILITGENGMGKSTLTRILISRLICEDPKGIEPCLQCEACKQMMPEKMNTYLEPNVQSGATINKSWTGRLLFDLIVNSLFYYPRYVWVDDIDTTPSGVVEGMLLPIDMHTTIPMLFTATHLDKLPPPFVQRMKLLRLSKPRAEELAPFVTLKCKQEGIGIADTEAVNELIRLANRNYRNILNILESIKDYGTSLSLTSLSEDHVLDNLGLQVGEKRFVAVGRGSGPK